MAVSGGHTPWLMLKRYQAKTSRGVASTWSRWMSVWPPPDTRIET